jgi:site-specific DNA recombinase
MKKLCAIYARVSTSGQDIKDQLESLPKFAEKQGWKIYRTYIDDGISGSSIDARPDFQRLLYDMDDRKFDVLLVEVHDRISRSDKNKERGLIMDALKENNIKLYSPTEGECDLSTDSGELITMFKLWQAGQERKDIRRRTLRGKKGKVKAGNAKSAGGRDRFGYIWDKEKKKYVLDKHIAELMLWTAKEYLNGKSLYQLSEILTDEKAYPIGYDWLLLVLQTRCDGLKIQFEGEEPIFFDVPPILPPEISTAVKAKIGTRKRSKTKHKYLFSGYIRCKACGLVLKGQTQKGNHRYYLHPNRRNCKCKAFATIWLDMIEEAVFETIFQYTFDLNGFNKIMKKALPDTNYRQIEEKRASKIERRLKNINKDLNKLVELALEGTLQNSTIKNKEHVLLKEQADLKEQLENIRHKLKSLPDIQFLKCEAEKLRQSMVGYFSSPGHLANMTFDEKKALLHRLFWNQDQNGAKCGIYVEKVNGDIHYDINANLFDATDFIDESYNEIQNNYNFDGPEWDNKYYNQSLTCLDKSKIYK